MPEAKSPTPPSPCPDPDPTELLQKICEAIDERIEVTPLLERVLELMAEHLGILKGAITLLDRRTQELMIDIAHGLSPAQKQRGRYQLGEGITGQVVQSGEPIALPRISKTSSFLNRTGALPSARLESTAFLCAPIKLEGEVLGALSIDLPSERADDAQLELLTIIATLISQSVAARQLKGAHKAHLGFENIIGRAKALKPVLEAIRTVADSDTTVLIRGESGTGKELVADAIHNASDRRGRPLLKVNCAALPETVLESELFGHEQGAFTGAIQQRKGRFELADGGTIFLDEIGDFSIGTQITLLRILQEQCFHRVGGAEPLTTNVRIIAATNRDLEALMSSGQFRQDLYYRLNVFPIHVPRCESAARTSRCWPTPSCKSTPRTCCASPPRRSICSWPTTGPATFASSRTASSARPCWPRRA